MEIAAFSPGTVTLTLRAEASPFIDLAPPAGPTVTLSSPNTQLVLEVGVPGPSGAAGTVAVGTTTTLAAGLSATVTNSGTNYAAVLNFGIPQGIQGTQGIQGIQGPAGSAGTSATITAGTTTTLAAGSPATVTNSGTESAAVFNFAIPQGIQGIQGVAGPAGVGVPAGGLTGQILQKSSNQDYATQWSTISIPSDRLTATVYNQTGATLTAGTVVYINGAHGNLPTVAKAQANVESTSAGTYGFVAASIGNMSSGTIIIAGVAENLDTSGFVDGDKIYLSPTVAGGWTITKPYAPDHMVYLGVITRAHPTLGTIQLRIANGFELEELHNVAAQTPSNNDLLAYESATSLWKNKSFATLGLPTLSGINAFTSRQSITVANDTAPALTITQTGSAYALRVEDSTSPDTTAFIVDALGNVMVGGPVTMGSYKMIVSGTMRASAVFVEHAGAVRSEGTLFVDSGTSSPMYLRPGIATAMTLLSNGNVGIGTLTPTNKLDVVGTITCNTQPSTDNSTKVATTAFAKSLWDYLVTSWSATPTASATSIAGGTVYEYTLAGTTRYRFVPTTYSPVQDAFYTAFSGGILSGLICTRG